MMGGFELEGVASAGRIQRIILKHRVRAATREAGVREHPPAAQTDVNGETKLGE